MGEEERKSRCTDADGSVPTMKITVPELSPGLARRPFGLREIYVCSHNISSRQKFCHLTTVADWYRMTKTTRHPRKKHSKCCILLHGSDSLHRLTVIDATNVQPDSRKPLVALARELHVLGLPLFLTSRKRSAKSGIGRGRIEIWAPMSSVIGTAATPLIPGLGTRGVSWRTRFQISTGTRRTRNCSAADVDRSTHRPWAVQHHR